MNPFEIVTKQDRDHAVNRLLIEDSKAHPEHAKARRETVRAWVKSFDANWPSEPFAALPAGAASLLRGLHAFEAVRAEVFVPTREMKDESGVNPDLLKTYENARLTGIVKNIDFAAGWRRNQIPRYEPEVQHDRRTDEGAIATIGETFNGLRLRSLLMIYRIYRTVGYEPIEALKQVLLTAVGQGKEIDKDAPLPPFDPALDQKLDRLIQAAERMHGISDDPFGFDRRFYNPRPRTPLYEKSFSFGDNKFEKYTFEKKGG